MKARQPSQALSRFEKVIELKPDYPPYRVNVAAALAALGRPSEAVEQAQKALTLGPLFEARVEFLDGIYRKERPTRKGGSTS